MSTSELDSRNIAISMRKSVENLVISSQDAIGQSISQALTFSGVITQHTNQMLQETGRSISRSPSPSLRTTADNTSDIVDNDKLEAADIELAVPSGRISDGKVTSPTPPRGAEARKKKSSWYSALYPTYKSRSDDFKRLFKDLDDERLIVDYSCALQKDILAHGRLYASQNFLCFHANIFGWETSVALRWKDVTAITKEKTALVIPNAILVCTDTEKHFFASFSGRDKAYLMLFRVWQNALMDQPMTSQEIWQWVHSCYGSELGFNSDDEGYSRDDDDKPPATPLPEDLAETSSMEAGGAESREDVRMRSTSTPPLASDAEGPRGRAGSTRRGARGDTLPTDMSDSSDSEPDKLSSAAGAEQCSSPHDGKLLLEQEYALNVDQLFTLVFTSSKMTLELLAKRNSRDFVHAAWQHNADSGLKSRQISYTLGLTTGPIGPKEVYVTEIQTMNQCSAPGVLYSIDVTSDNAGIPYADYFQVATHYCARRAAGGGGARLQVYGQVKYKKSLWPMIKAFLEKNALGGLEEYTKMLDAALKAEAEDAAPAKRKGRRRRRRASSTAPVPSTLSPPLPGVGGVGSRGGAGGAGGGGGAGWLGAALAVLLVTNVALYWRLARVPPATHHDLRDRVSALSSEQMAQWSALLEAHAARHHTQLAEWREALAAAILDIEQTEQSLMKLHDSIKPSLERAQREASATPDEPRDVHQPEDDALHDQVIPPTPPDIHVEF